jgi:4-carboxymuconolactone decarboxylase
MDRGCRGWDVSRSAETARGQRCRIADAETPDAAVAHIDPKSLALARLAALIAIGGADPSFGEHADAAVSTGATADEIVDVLVGVRTIVGEPRVVAAAPQLALALGYDLDGVDC